MLDPVEPALAALVSCVDVAKERAWFEEHPEAGQYTKPFGEMLADLQAGFKDGEPGALETQSEYMRACRSCEWQLGQDVVNGRERDAVEDCPPEAKLAAAKVEAKE